jgi:hypothetical protein
MTIQIDPAALAAASKVGVDITSLVKDAEKATAGALGSPPTTITVGVGGIPMIPEIGEGGFTDPSTGGVRIGIDPHSSIGLATTLHIWLPLGLSHELDHSARILDGPGYGATLLDAMVSEGLADGFSRSVHSDAPEIPWDRAISRADERALWARARPLLYLSNYTLTRSWLFGSGDIPRWTAYTIGANLVAAYHARHPDVSWKVLTRAKAADILAGSGYSP